MKKIFSVLALSAVCLLAQAQTQVWKLDKNSVLIRTNDPVKEAIAMDYFPRHRNLPVCKKIGVCNKTKKNYQEGKYIIKIKNRFEFIHASF